MADEDDTKSASGSGGGGGGSARKVAFGEVKTVHADEHIMDEPLMASVADPVGLRLYAKGIAQREQRQRVQHAVEQQQKEEERDAKRARPWVTTAAKNHARDDFKSFLMVQDKWLKGKADNLYRKTKDAHIENQDHIESKKEWAPSTRSSQIVKRKVDRGDYTGPQSSWKACFSKYIKSKNAVRDVDDFEPVINEKSRQLVRPVPAHERLYSLAAEREEGLMILRAWEHDKSMIDPTTGAPRFQPTVLTSPHAEAHYDHQRRSQSHSRSPSASHSRAHSRSGAGRTPSPSVASSTTSRFSKRRSFNELIEHLHAPKSEPKHPHSLSHELAACTFAPRTNPTSSLILEKSGPRPPLYQTTSTLMRWDRAASRSPSADNEHMFSSSGGGGRSPMYPPSDVSDEQAAQMRRESRERNKQFWARQMRDQVDKEARTQRLRRELVCKEQEDCTFHPQISKRSHEIFEGSKYAQLNAAAAVAAAATGGRVDDGGVAYQPQFPARASRSASPQRRVPAQPDDTNTASFIRQIEEEHARDREAGARERARLRAASTSLPRRSASCEPPLPADNIGAVNGSVAASPPPPPPRPTSIARSRSEQGITVSSTPGGADPHATPPTYTTASDSLSTSRRRPQFASGGVTASLPRASTTSAARSATVGALSTAAYVPSPVASPANAPSPFISSLQSELKTVIDGWKGYGV